MKPRLIFKDGEWHDSPLKNGQPVQLLRQQIFDLQQALLRTEIEKGRLYSDLAHALREADLARKEIQLLRNERRRLRDLAVRIWVRLGKWLGVPQQDDL